MYYTWVEEEMHTKYFEVEEKGKYYLEGIV
jgi:hypothetical protein